METSQTIKAVLKRWPGGYEYVYELKHTLMCKWRNNTGDRVVYDPTWSTEYPYKTYRGSAAQRIFGSLHAAIAYLGEPRLDKWTCIP
jgi:hypothetical protein